MSSRLRKIYDEEIKISLQEKMKYKSSMEVPAIQKIRKLKIEYVIVRKPKKYSNANIEYNIKFYDFNKKINNNIKWIYISTPIKTHYKIVNKYLDENKNIICEKPLTHSFIKTKKLIDKALAKNLILHEVDMYKHHIQYKGFQKK